jgi:hypothetical protein
MRRVLGILLALCLPVTVTTAESTSAFMQHEKVRVPKRAGGDEMRRVAQILQSVSTLEGITYYSQTRKKETVLYDACYMVDGPKSKKRIADSFEHVATGQPCYYLQDDSSLGPAVFRAVYHQTLDTVTLESQNVDALKAGIITVAAPEKLRLVVTVTDKGAELEVDVRMEADLKKIAFAQGFIERSLQARFEAVFKWFEKEYQPS